MFANLSLGALLIAATVLIHTFGLIGLHRTMQQALPHFRLQSNLAGRALAMTSTVLGLFLVHTVEVWTWAGAYLQLGAVRGLENALYFATVTYSTLGYGDITLQRDWRLLSALEGIDGFILIGWSTAYLVAASTRYGPFRAGEHF
jgi:hypothetical protein